MSQLIFKYQLAGLYKMEALKFNELNTNYNTIA